MAKSKREMASSDEDDMSSEDEVMARIRRRAEMVPSDEDGEDDEEEDDELARIRRRAELVPSDDDSDDGSSDDGDQHNENVGNLCSLADGSSDDDDGSDGDMEPQEQSASIKTQQTSNLSDDDDDSDDEEETEKRGESDESDVDDDIEESSDFDSDDSEEYEVRDTRALSDIPLYERVVMKMHGGEGQTIEKGATSKYPSHLKPNRGPPSQSASSYNEPKAKKSKHAPMEQSSKWAVGRHREVVTVKKVHHRDPRFEELGSTPLSSKAAEGAYSFLDDKRKNELTKLKTEIRKEKRKRKGRAGGEESKIEILRSAETRLKQSEQQRQQHHSDKHALSEWKDKEKKSVAAGKQPFYLKKKAAKELLLEARFDGIRKGKGGKKRVEKILERKRKKTAVRERKFLPEERRNF